MTQQEEDRIALQCLEAFDCGEYQDRLDMLRGFLARIRAESEPRAWRLKGYSNIFTMERSTADMQSERWEPLFTTPPAAPTEITDGWQLVPKEPTCGWMK